MKRMEVPRLSLQNLQAKPCTVTPEAVKHSKPSQGQYHAEPSPPPSRVLRNGKRVPTGTASKTVPRTQSQVGRVSSHDSPSKLQAAYQTTENAEIAKASSSKANNPRIAGSPLSQLPLNKQMFSSPQVSRTSEPAQQLTPPPTVPTAVAVPPSSKAPSSLLYAPADPTLAPAAFDSPTTASPAVTSDAFSNTPVLGHSSQAAASFASPPTVHMPVSPEQMTGSNFSAAPTSDSVTSPPAFTAVSRLSDAPATPTLFPTAAQSTPAVPHPTPAAPHSTPVAFTGMDTSGMLSHPMFSNQASPDEVATSLQNLNLQSQPFNFADEAPGSGVKASAPAQSPGLGMSMLPGDDSISPPWNHNVPTASEHDSAPVGDTMVNDGKVNVQNRQEEEHVDRSEQDTVPVNYVSRRTTDPYMEKKLRGLQKEEWSEADITFKRHKSRLEMAKEQAAAARTSELSSTENAAVRRLVQGAFQRVVATGGQSLGESMVKHKSRLQVEKEQAVQQRKAEEAAQAQRAKRKSLGGLGKHKSRLEKEKEAAAAARKSSSGGSSPAVPKRLPSYMRPTSASKAMQVPKGLGEDVTKPKSRLEREKKAAAALRASSDSLPLRKSICNVRSKVAEAWQGQSLDVVMHKRKSKLQLDKENAAAAANKSPPAPKQLSAAPRKSFGFGGQGLGEMKVHKTKLQREQDAWAKAAAAEEAESKPNLRKSVTSSISQKPTAVPAKKVPSYMKSTHTSQTRMSLDGSTDTDARFAF